MTEEYWEQHEMDRDRSDEADEPAYTEEELIDIWEDISRNVGFDSNFGE